MLLVHALLILTAIFTTQSGSWEFQFEKEGVKVYTKNVDGSSFKAFKGEAVFDIGVDQIVAQIMEISSYPDWCYRTTSTTLLKKENNKLYYHYVSQTPPLIQDREAYFYTELLPASNTGEITIKLGTYNTDKEVPDGFVRMPYANGCWKLTPLNANQTAVVFEMQAEPGGLIPAWIANMASSDSPWITMSNIQKVISQKQR